MQGRISQSIELGDGAVGGAELQALDEALQQQLDSRVINDCGSSFNRESTRISRRRASVAVPTACTFTDDAAFERFALFSEVASASALLAVQPARKGAAVTPRGRR